MIIQIPPSALKELQQLENKDWSVSAQELVDWVNHIAVRFLPANTPDKSGRVSENLSLRAMRYYQTLGCIDAPVREGREAHYGFRHYLQALLVRKMLWQRVPASTMAELLPGRTTDEYKNLLLEDIQLIAKPGSTQSPRSSIEASETWRRLRVCDGIELHLGEKIARIDGKSIPAILEKIEAALRRQAAAKR
jgi:DNA-binding transcriptional MerR regulator